MTLTQNTKKMNIKTPVTEKIEQFLYKYPHLRDDDNKLIATIWKWQVDNFHSENIDNMSAMDLLHFYAKRKLASAESIRRSRQKIQELNIALRGKKYEQRHKASEKVKQQLKVWDEETKFCGCSNPSPVVWNGVTACEECGLIIREKK